MDHFYITFRAAAGTAGGTSQRQQQQQQHLRHDDQSGVRIGMHPWVLMVLLYLTRAVHGLEQGTALDRWQDYPYFAALDGPVLCGGAIIADTWIVTASHCLVNNTVKEVLVANLDDHKQQCTNRNSMMIPWERQGTPVPVKQVINHPSYLVNPRFENYVYDIGLIELSVPVKNRRIAIASEGQQEQGQTHFFIGVGYTSSSGGMARQLQGIEGTMAMVPPVTDMLLMTLPDGVALCHGDSGGPLINNSGDDDKKTRILTGVLSRIFNTHDPDPAKITCPVPNSSTDIVYNAFVDLTRHLNWIAETTGLSKESYTTLPSPSPSYNDTGPCIDNRAIRTNRRRPTFSSLDFVLLITVAAINYFPFV